MTAFSNPVLLPWIRQAPRYATTTRPSALGGIARAGDGLAIAVWGERVDREGTGGSFLHSSPLMNLGGIRYTEAGPEIVATPLILPPSDDTRTGLSLDAMTSVGDEVWALFSYDDATTQANSEFRMARLTLNAATLEVSVQWRWTLPKGGITYDPALLDVWPEQRRAVISTHRGSTAGGKPENAVYLVDLDLGTLIAWQAIPLRSSSVTSPRSITINPAIGQVLLHGERIVSGRDRSAFWTSPITASSLGAWTYRTHLPAPVSTQDYGPEKIAVIARSDGRWEYAASQYPTWTTLRHGFYTHPSSVAEDPDPLSTSFSGWISAAGNPVCVVRDGSMNRTIVGFTTPSNRTPEVPGATGGCYHVELDESTTTETVLLPGTDFAVKPDNIQCVNFGDGRFLYLLGAIGVNQSYVNDFASYGFNIWAAGPTQVLPEPPGIKGEAPYEHKSYFRSVN